MRQHAHLDFAGDAQFAGDLLLHRVAVSLGLEQRLHARLHFEHLERLGEIIVRARLEAARLVLHLFERRQKHDRHLGRLRHLAHAAGRLRSRPCPASRCRAAPNPAACARRPATPSRHSARGSACGRPSSLRPGCRGWPWHRPRSARGSRKVFSCRRKILRCLFQLRLRVGEGITLHQFFKLRPRLAGEQRAQRGLVRLDEIRRAGIEFRQQLLQLRRCFARLRGACHWRNVAEQIAADWISTRSAIRANNGSSAAETFCLAASTSSVSALARMSFSNSPAADWTGFAPMFPATPLSVCARSLSQSDVTFRQSRPKFARLPGLAARRIGAAVSDTISDFLRRGSSRLLCRAPRCLANHHSIAERGLQPASPARRAVCWLCKTAPRSRINSPDQSAWRCGRSCRRRDNAGVSSIVACAVMAMIGRFAKRVSARSFAVA